MSKKIPTSILSLLILILLGAVWGTGYSIARFAMTNGVSPLGYSFWQSIGPAIIITSIAFYREAKTLFKPTLSRTLFYFICGLTGIVIPNTTMYFAAPHLPASIMAMIVNTVPIIAYPLALLARQETFHWQRVLGIAFACCGLLLIILPKASLPTPEMVPWVISTLITPISFAVCSVFISRYQPPNTDALTLSAGMLVLSSLMLIPFVLLKDQFYAFHYPLTLADWVVLLEIGLSSLGYILFFLLIKMAGPVFYSLVNTIVVMTGIFWGYFIFDERLNQWTATALVFVILALLLVTRYQRESAQVQHETT